jgi:serine/threonine-protein kinase RsbW
MRPAGDLSFSSLPAKSTLRGARRMSDLVELTLPVQGDLVVLARFAAGTIASRANFNVEEIEDLRLAVDELCVSLAEGKKDGRLRLRYLRDHDHVEVVCAFIAASGVDGVESTFEEKESLSARIVDALVDVHGHDSEGGHPRAWLRKQRTSRPG